MRTNAWLIQLREFIFCGFICVWATSGFAAQDLSLDDAIQLGLKQNSDILNALQEIRRIDGQYLEVRAQALPRIGLTTTYNQQSETLLENAFSGGEGMSATGATGFATANDKSWRIAFEGQQLLYSGGQVSAALKIAEITKTSTVYSLRDTIGRVIAEIRKQYYQVILNRSLIDVQTESVRLLEEELDSQKTRFDAGTVPRLNVLRAEVELANARPLLIRAKSNYRIAQYQLARLLGSDASSISGESLPFDVTGSLDYTPISPSLSDSIATAMERRAFLKVQRQNILAEKEQIKVALSGYYPRVEANAGYEYRNSSFSEQLDDTIEGWFLGLTGTWNIFDGFETAGKVKQARARFESAKINYEDSVRQVEVEVQEAYSRLNEAKELIQSQQKNVESALEALRLARERFSVGAATQLDVLDSRVALTRAAITELEARFDYNVALADFKRVTATDTEYAETFEDPLVKNSKKFRQAMRDKK